MSEQSEWRLAVVSELVWAVLPERRQDAKPWADIGARAEYVYERDRDNWQRGDPNFEVYSDAFINKAYIVGRVSAIRNHLAAKGRAIVFTNCGGKGGSVYRATTVAEMDEMFAARQRIVKGMTDGCNTAIEIARQAMPELTVPYLRTVPELPAGSPSEN